MLYPLYTNSQSYNMKKVCLYCEREFEVYHGNRKYCDDDCYYEMKKFRNHKSYYNQKAALIEIYRNEKLLKMLYERYGNSLIDEKHYSSLNFNWDVKTGVIQHNNEFYDLVGSFGYIIYNNRKIKIINYGNNDF